jgi:DNA-binding PadR family transcriptional regulator
MRAFEEHGVGAGLSDLGRFSEPALLILLSLAQGEKHGYAMMQDIKQLSGLDIGPGTLYGAIARLEERGLIEPLPSEDRRRPYRLTDLGRSVLGHELERWERVVGTGRQRLAPS